MRTEDRILADINRFTAARQTIYRRLNGRAMPAEDKTAIEAIDARIDQLYVELRRTRHIPRRRRPSAALDRYVNRSLKPPPRKGGDSAV